MSGKLTLQEKIADNIWDHLSQVLPILKAARNGKWSWMNNARCKYIELRVDMRTGHCILSDKDSVRINPEDLAKQSYAGGGLPWRWPVNTKRSQEYNDKCRDAIQDACEDINEDCWNTRYVKSLNKRGLCIAAGKLEMMIERPDLYPDRGLPCHAPLPVESDKLTWSKDSLIVWMA